MPEPEPTAEPTAEPTPESPSDTSTAGDELLAMAYDQLRLIAAAHLSREKPGQTLQPTALVHEAYCRLVGGANQNQWNSERHFLGAATLAMRRILVENARRKQIPQVWKLTKFNALVQGAIGRQPHLRSLNDSDIPGGIVSLIDRYRDDQIQLFWITIALRLAQMSLADRLEAAYDAKIKAAGVEASLPLMIEISGDEVGVPQPDLGGRTIPLGAQMARISNIGDATLRDVVVICRTDMHPLTSEDDANRAEINLLNSFFDNNGKRVAAADEYMRTAQLMHATSEATTVYLRHLGPGDIAYIPCYSTQSHFGVKEARVSVYATSGTRRDVVVLQKEKYRDSDGWVKDKTSQRKPVPEFTHPLNYERWELETAKPVEAPYPAIAELCVPQGEGFVGLGIPRQITLGQTYSVIAKSQAGFIITLPATSGGEHLVRLPKAWQSKFNMLDLRTDQEREAAKKEAEARERRELLRRQRESKFNLR